MDKSHTVKSNYEKKLHSCPRNHVCQRPHNEHGASLNEPDVPREYSFSPWYYTHAHVLLKSFFPLYGKKKYSVRLEKPSVSVWYSSRGWSYWFRLTHSRMHTWRVSNPAGVCCACSDWGADRNDMVDAPQLWMATWAVITSILAASRSELSARQSQKKSGHRFAVI